LLNFGKGAGLFNDTVCFLVVLELTEFLLELGESILEVGELILELGELILKFGESILELGESIPVLIVSCGEELIELLENDLANDLIESKFYQNKLFNFCYVNLVNLMNLINS